MKGEVVEPEGPKYRQHKVQKRRDLISKLLWGHVQVTVVLSEASDTHQSVQCA